MSRDDLRSSCSQSRTCILFLIQVNAFKYFQCNEISCASVGNMFRQIMLSRAARRRPDGSVAVGELSDAMTAWHRERCSWGLSYLSACLSVCLFCLFVCLSVSQSGSLSVCFSVCLSVFCARRFAISNPVFLSAAVWGLRY